LRHEQVRIHGRNSDKVSDRVCLVDIPGNGYDF